jgi:F0F1-type ATP synthase assembly protein I
MQPAGTHSGDLSHDSPLAGAHRTAVTAPDAAVAVAAAAVSPAAARGKRFYNVLSASSVGLEMGLSVVIAVLFGIWLDGKLGTAPLMMLLWLGVGFAAGLRGVLRAVRRADRADQEAARG